MPVAARAIAAALAAAAEAELNLGGIVFFRFNRPLEERLAQLEEEKEEARSLSRVLLPLERENRERGLGTA